MLAHVTNYRSIATASSYRIAVSYAAPAASPETHYLHSVCVLPVSVLLLAVLHPRCRKDQDARGCAVQYDSIGTISHPPEADESGAV